MLYQHQHTALQKSISSKAFAYFMEMGTGKTVVAIHDANRALKTKQVTRVLVICPNTIKQVWAEELDKHSPSSSYSFWPKWTDTDYLIINIEALSHKSIVNKVVKQLSKERLFIIVDESQTIKKHTAKRSKYTQMLGDKFGVYKRILTGTPITRNIQDIYSQFRFLAPEVFGTNFYAFRNQYIEMGGFHIKRMIHGRMCKIPTEIIGYKNMPEFQRKIKPYIHQVNLSDVMDMPDKIYQRRYIELTPEQKRYYEDVRDNMRTMIAEEHVSITIVLTQILRLQQIISGYLPTDQGTIMHFDSGKLDAVKEIIEEVDHGVIIFIKFNEEVENLVTMIREEFDYKCGLITGKSTPKERQEALTKFQAGELKVLISNIEISQGFTATAAKTAIFYTNSFNYGTRVQAEARIHRIGQDKAVNYIDIIARNTVDELVLTTLNKKQSLANVIKTMEI